MGGLEKSTRKKGESVGHRAFTRGRGSITNKGVPLGYLPIQTQRKEGKKKSTKKEVRYERGGEKNYGGRASGRMSSNRRKKSG